MEFVLVLHSFFLGKGVSYAARYCYAALHFFTCILIKLGPLDTVSMESIHKVLGGIFHTLIFCIGAFIATRVQHGGKLTIGSIFNFTVGDCHFDLFRKCVSILN